MSKTINKLSGAFCQNVTDPGMHADGGGLYLVVTPKRAGGVAKSWVVRFATPAGTRREMGLGAYPEVSLAEARDRANEKRMLAREGIDPLQRRDQDRADAIAKARRLIKFREAVETYALAHTASFKTEKGRKLWINMFRTHAFPALGDMPVEEISNEDIARMLQPIWQAKPETARKLRGRTEMVFDFAAVKGMRDPNKRNPAALRGNLNLLLPKRLAIKPSGHHAAMPIDDVPDFMGEVANVRKLGGRALEITILETMRTSETLDATAREFDLDKAIWTVPAARMKAARDHRQPLSTQAVAILRKIMPSDPNAYVFPGYKDGKPLSDMAMSMLLRRLGKTDYTVHGFRSSFKDWATDRTDFERDAIEICLAHTVGDSTEMAYRRGDMLEKRRLIIQAWADFIMPQQQTLAAAA